MKLRFIPRDIGMWRSTFDFSPEIYACEMGLTTYKEFHTQEELFEFLKSHGVRLDDPDYPLVLSDEIDHHSFGKNVKSVVQWSLVGWIKEIY